MSRSQLQRGIGSNQPKRCIFCRRLMYESAEEISADTRRKPAICDKCQTP